MYYFKNEMKHKMTPKQRNNNKNHAFKIKGKRHLLHANLRRCVYTTWLILSFFSIVALQASSIEYALTLSSGLEIHSAMNGEHCCINHTVTY